MLNPITLDDPNWFYCWVNDWVALDTERGAYLRRSAGRGRSGTRIYNLIVMGPGKLFSHGGDSLYHKRLRVYSWSAIDEVLAIADKYLDAYFAKHPIDEN